MALAGLLLAALVVGLLIYIVRSAYSRPDNFPPGPPAVPIWGSYLQLLLENFTYPYLVLDAMTRRYKTKVLGFYFGPMPTVVACDYESVKEVLNNPHIQGRVLNVAVEKRMYNKDHGLFFSEGPKWLEQKRFALRYMRDFGFGRRSERLESDIEAEMRDLVDLIRGGREDPAVVRPSSADGSARRVLLPDAMYPAFVNSILTVYASARLPRSADETARELSRAGMQVHRSGDSTGGFLTLHRWLADVAPKMSGFRDATTGNTVMRGFLEKMIEEHKKTYADDFMRDFIDIYLREIKEREKTGEPTPFSTDELAVILLDLFLPSVTAVPVTITWALLYLAHYPEVLQRVQQEVDSVVGNSRLPNLNDRPNLPYTEATIREVMRRTTLLPIGLPHKAIEDTKIQGYFVPKGSAVLTCLWSMHMDNDFWGDPENFRPERFLDNGGKLNKKDFTMPFGAGKRLCAGETFARQNLFLGFATLVQNFTINPDDVPGLNCNIPGVIETTPSFWAQLVPR